MKDKLIAQKFQEKFESMGLDVVVEEVLENSCNSTILKVQFEKRVEVWKCTGSQLIESEKKNYRRIVEKIPNWQEVTAYIERSIAGLESFIFMDFLQSDLINFFLSPHNSEQIAETSRALYAQKQPFWETLNCWSLFKMIVEKVNILHKHGIMHLDLKLENILVNYTIWPFRVTELRLCDFQSQLEGSKIIKITAEYASPEYYAAKAENRKSAFDFSYDMFSLGIIAFLLKFSFYPFFSSRICDTFYRYMAENRQSEYWEKIERVLEKQKKEIPISEREKKLFNNLFAREPNERLTCEQVIGLLSDHSWPL